MKGTSLFKHPSAWIPLLMSLAALILILGYVTIFGFAQSGNGEEGAPARIFQLIMVAQVPIIAYFGIKYLPQRPRDSLLVLVFQAVAWIIPIAAVMWFERM